MACTEIAACREHVQCIFKEVTKLAVNLLHPSENDQIDLIAENNKREAAAAAAAFVGLRGAPNSS
jgi:hypothetical protein